MKQNNLPSRIFGSCVTKRTSEGEKFIEQHVFDYIISGKSEVYIAGKLQNYQGGDLRYVKRNSICKFYKHPMPGTPYESITICISQDILLKLYAEYDKPEINKTARIDNVVPLRSNALFKNYLDSLKPYISNDQSKRVTEIKAKEAVIILLEINPFLKDVLFDFNEPGKIDLEHFMNQHYKMDTGLEQFAYLTGRSLSTFKRDFAQIFHVTPNKWLLAKRLSEAKFMIAQKKLAPTSVYFEVGFKDYSHFSVAFKKEFGHAPSYYV